MYCLQNILSFQRAFHITMNVYHFDTQKKNTLFNQKSTNIENITTLDQY